MTTIHRVATLGDSETDGGGLSGPRPWLYRGLRAAGYAVRFVGSTVSRSGFATYDPSPIPYQDRAAIATQETPWPTMSRGWDQPLTDTHGGDGILTTDGIAAARLAAIAPALGANDAIVLLTGGNDLGGAASGATCATRLATLLATIKASAPGVPVLVSGPYPRIDSTETARAAFDALIPGVCAAAGTQFHYVGAVAQSVSTATLGDLDPGSGEALPQGYRKVAAAWQAALVAPWGAPDAPRVPRRMRQRAAPAATLRIASASSHVSIPYSAAITPTTGSFWLALWMMPLIEDANFRTIVQMTRSDFTGGCTILHAGPVVKALIQGEGGYQPIAANGWTVNRWHRLVLVADAAALQTQIYLDGILCDQQSQLAWSFSANDTISLGGSADLTTSDPGFYSDFQVGASAPTFLDVEADYYEGTPMPGIACRYRLDEGTGAGVVDSLSVGSAGTVTGGAWSATVLPPIGVRA